MKLRSTLLFAAASLTASALAPVVMTPSAYGAGEIISLNFTNESVLIDSTKTGTAGLATYDNGGIETAVDANGWTNITSTAGTTVSSVFNYDGTVLDGVSVTASNAVGGSWYSDCETGTVAGTLQNRYWDVSNRQTTFWTVAIDTPFLVCDVYVYFSGDTGDGTFSSVSVNGISYMGDTTGSVAGSGSWGDASKTTAQTTELTLGTNALKVSGVSGSLALTNDYISATARGTLSGIQVVNTYAGTATSVALDGSVTDWTDTTIGGETWINSTPEAGTYAAFNLTANTTVNVTGTSVATDAITATGSGVLTLSGNTISLIGPATLRTDSETASLVVNNDLLFSSSGVVAGNVTLNGSITFENGANLASGVAFGDSATMTVKGGTLSIATQAAPAAISVAKGAMVSLTSAQSGVVDATNISGEGTLGVAFDSSYGGTVNITNTAFKGDVYVTSGNFTINDAVFNDTLRLAGGVNFQLTVGSEVTFSKNLVLEGTTQVHQNGNANLTFDKNSSVSGSGTFERRAGGTLMFNGTVDLGGFTTGSSATTIFAGTTTLGTASVSQGSVKFTGTTSIDTLVFNGNGTVEMSSDATLGEIAVRGNSITSGALTIKSGVEVSATSLTNNWGLSSLTVDGKLTLSDRLYYWSGVGTNSIGGTGIIVAESVVFGNQGTYAVALNRLEVGGGGMTGTGGAGGLSFGAATIVATEDWTSSAGMAFALTSSEGTTFEMESASGHGTSATLSGAISGEGALIKTGVGTLTLSGANTYTGGTTISAGTVAVENGGALGTGAVALTTSGTRLANKTDSTVTVSKLTTVSGAILDLGASGSTSAAGFVSTETATIAKGTLFWADSFEQGKRLVSGVGSDFDVSGFSLSNLFVNGGAAANSRGSVAFGVVDGTLLLSSYTAGAVYDLTWNGSDSANVWTSGGVATPWLKNGTSDVSNFETGDSVTFSDSATNKNVKIDGIVNPAALVFTNSAGNDYVFAKADDAATAALVGNTTINKSGTGSVTVDSSVDVSRFTGNIAITEGALIFDHTTDLTVSNVLSGSGTFEKTGSGTMVLTGDNGGFTGTLAISGGILKLGSITALGAGYSSSHSDLVDVVVKTGGTLDLNGQTKDGYYGNYTLAGGALINTGAEIGLDKRQLAGGITLTADSEVGGTSGFGMISSGYSANTLSLNGYTLTKTGTNTFFLASTTIEAGTVNIVGGTIFQAGESDGSAADFTIGGSGALRLNGINFSVKSITSSGDGVVGLGGATLTLLGDSTLTRIDTLGTVKVSSGVTLALVGASFNTVGFVLEGGSILELQGAEASFTNVISGSGAVVKKTEGSLTLTSTNTYTGGTTIESGTLKITQDAALSTGAVTVNENGVLEVAYGGTFSRTVVGTGTIAKSGSADLTVSSAFAGSFNVKEGLLVVDGAESRSFNNLSIASGATFKANKNIEFKSVSEVSGTLAGASASTQVSVASGSFAGTLNNVTLVKTGADTAIDFSGATFATGGKIMVEAGTADNLTLADGGTLQLSATSGGQITLSNLTLGTGTLVVDELFDETTAMATISDSLSAADSNFTLSLDISGIEYRQTYALFTFDDTTKAQWESIFGTLSSDGKFNSNLVLSGGVGTAEYGAFSWVGNTLCFIEQNDAKEFTWTAVLGSGEWNLTDANWNDNPAESFDNNMAAIFSSAKVEEGYYAADKNVTVTVNSEIRASSVTVDLGEDGYMSLKDGGNGHLKVSEGISVNSGTLNFVAGDFYTGEFIVNENGILALDSGEADAVTLTNTLSGTGTLQYNTAGTTLALSGDRSGFTGALNVNAGTVALTNSTGTEAFSAITIASGATLSETAENVSALTLGQLAGTGTLLVSDTGSDSFTLNLAGSTFSGTLELNALDLALGGDAKSDLASVSSVRLTNGASLNFFDEAATLDKTLEVADSNGAIRVAAENAGVTISGSVSGAGTLSVQGGGTVAFTGSMTDAKLHVDSASAIELSGADKTFNSLTSSDASATLTLGGNVSLATPFAASQFGAVNLNADTAFTVRGVVSGTSAEISGENEKTSVLTAYGLSVGGTTALSDLRVNLYDDGIVASEGSDSAELQLNNVVFGLADSAEAWTADLAVALKLNGGTTTFDVDADKTITIAGTISEAVAEAQGTEGEEGYVPATSSTLVKTGAGTLTLAQANANAGGTTIAEGTLKFTNAENGVALENASYTFTGGKMGAGEKTTVSVGAGTAFAGAAILTADKSGVWNFAADNTISGEGNSLTLESSSSGVKVTVDEDVTLTVFDLRLAGPSANTITGEGTLALNGTLTVASDKTPTHMISVSELVLTGDTVTDIQKGTLKVSSSDGVSFAANGNKLTKTGAGTLSLESDTLSDFDGSMTVSEGKVKINNDLSFTIGADKTFELGKGATLEFNEGFGLELKGTGTLDAGTISGNLTLSDATLLFTGSAKLKGGTFSWSGSNLVTLDSEFRKTITALPFSLLTYDAKGEGLDDAGLVFTDTEAYGRRNLALYVGEKALQVVATGTLVWNDKVTQWTTDYKKEADWDYETFNPDTGKVETEASEFRKNDYVEFRNAGSIQIIEDINTSGMVFNLASGNFTLAVKVANPDNQEKQEYFTIADAASGANAGLTVLGGNVTVSKFLTLDLSSITVSGGSLTVYNNKALGSENAVVTLGGLDADGNALNGSLNFVFEKDGETEIEVGRQLNVVKKGTITVNAGALDEGLRAGATVKFTEAISGEGAELTKAGAGTLEMLRTSTLDTLVVSAGAVTLSGEGADTLGIKNATVNAGAKLTLTGDSAKGANTAFGELTIGGAMTVNGGQFRAETVTGAGTKGVLTGELSVGAAGTKFVTDTGVTLTVAGSVGAYEDGAVVTKTGAGTLKLVGGAEKQAFTLDADFVQNRISDNRKEGGTVEFTNGGTVTGKYTVAEQTQATVSFGGDNTDSALAGGLVVGANATATVKTTGSGTLSIAGVDAGGEKTKVSFGGNIQITGEKADFGTITEVTEDATLSALSILASSKVSVSTDTFTAGLVSLSDGATLKIDAETAATANALWVGSGNTATLDLSGDAKLSVAMAENVSVLGGTGTLKVLGGTLDVSGYNSSWLNDRPTIVLSDATFNFDVAHDETVYTSCLSSLKTENGKGTFAKSGDGALFVLAYGELGFDGSIAVNEGSLVLSATASEADMTIASNAGVDFYGTAELGNEIDGVNTLAKSLTGEGVLSVYGELYANANTAFNGEIEAAGGTVYVNSETEAWLNDVSGSNRAIGVSSFVEEDVSYHSGTIATYDEAVTLEKVTITDLGTFFGASEDAVLTVQDVSVKAVIDSSWCGVVLDGYGSLGTLTFDAQAVWTDLDVSGTWTMTGKSTNLGWVTITGALTVENAEALGSAFVQNRGVLKIAADGTYKNNISLYDTATVQAVGDVNLTGSFSGAPTAAKFIVGTDAGEVSTLTVNQSVFGLITDDITFVVNENGTFAANVASNRTFKGVFEGKGTFEKLGGAVLTVNSDAGSVGAISVSAGTLAFASESKLSLSDGGAGTLSVANGATLKLTSAKLADFELTGNGSAIISGESSVKSVSSATDVALGAGTFSVSGDVAESNLAFENADAKLKLVGTDAQSVADTTVLSGATVTLVNDNAKADVVCDAVLADSVKTLVLTASSGVTGGVLNSTFAGSLTKTYDGTWTVTDYTFGATADQAMKIQNAGTLVWKNAKLGGNAGAIELGDEATLKIVGLAEGETMLSASVAGNGTLEISATGTEDAPLELNADAADGAEWTLHVSDGSRVKVTQALPGDLWLENDNSVLVLDTDEGIVAGGEHYYRIQMGSTLELVNEALSLTFEDTDDTKTPHLISGAVKINGSSVVQKGNIQWDTTADLNIEKGSFTVATTKEVEANTAKLLGSGDFAVESTGNTYYKLNGELSAFAGNVDIASGAKVRLGKTLFTEAKVTVDGELSVALTGTSGGRVLKNISGTGTLAIDTPDNYYTRFGVYAYDTASNGDFTGTLAVRSGVLSVDAGDLDSIAAATVNVGGSDIAEYYEGKWSGEDYDGIVTGGFLQINKGVAYDLASLNTEKIKLGTHAGMILNGGTFTASSNFGGGKSNLLVLSGKSTLSMANGVKANTGVFVERETVLEIGNGTASAASVARAATSASVANASVAGDLTLNGELLIHVTDASLAKGALLGVGGDVTLSSTGEKTAEITLDLAGVTDSLENKQVVILGGGLGVTSPTELAELVSVSDGTGTDYKIVNRNGKLAILNSTTEFTEAPSGLSSLYNVIRSGEGLLWDYIQEDLAKSESRLVALSPVSFGSLVEMQSGFASLENDLLRERLEQRRYERAFASDVRTPFKPFVNVVGADREGDGNGTDSANYDITHTGVLGGFDVAVSRNTVVGISLGMDWAKADLHDGAGKHEATVTRLGFYGMSVFGNAYVGYGVSAGVSSFDTKRNAYQGETLTGETDGQDVNATLLFGAGWTINETLGIDVAPYVGLDFGYATVDSFSEKGGTESALDVGKIDRNSLRAKIGATLSWRAAECLRFGIDAAFSHEFLDSDTDIDAKFVSGELAGSAFSSTAYLMDENTIQIGPRVDFRINDHWSASAAYTFETDLDDTMTHSANLGLRARF